MSGTFEGAFAALYSPMDAAGALDEPALRGLCERLIDGGVSLVPCGTTGETPTLNVEERARVVEIAVETAAGRAPVIVGTGSNNTAATVASTRAAAAQGADGALVVTPYYNKPPQGALLQHFTRVADEGGLPVVLYNVPGRTGCALAADTILELAEHPQIVGIKEASADLDLFQTLLNESPDDFSILSGDDAWTAPVMLLGAHGVVSVAANVVPRAISALVSSAGRGDIERTRYLQGGLLPLFRALFCTTNPIPVKRAAELLGHARRDLRLPLTAESMTSSMVSELQRALETAQGIGEDK